MVFLISYSTIRDFRKKSSWTRRLYKKQGPYRHFSLHWDNDLGDPRTEIYDSSSSLKIHNWFPVKISYALK